MAALTDNKEVLEKHRRLLAHECGVDILYKGAMAKINAAGYLVAMAAEAGAKFAGIVYGAVDNSGGSVGDEDCLVLREGVFQLAGAGFTIADMGSIVYASDDQTVSTTQGANELAIGTITKIVSATLVEVDIAV